MFSKMATAMGPAEQNDQLPLNVEPPLQTRNYEQNRLGREAVRD